ncbi:30S ribosomal protein S17 [Patescibacteria group bacterium]|nr:30S ribosomal protein S17 [Patescibacteria group bacterium]
MKKRFEGIIVSLKMQNTASVEISRRVPHPLYKKLLKRSKKFKADYSNMELKIGDKVRIEETKPISKDKKFKVVEVIK